jgi:hypothetical protein
LSKWKKTGLILFSLSKSINCEKISWCETTSKRDLTHGKNPFQLFSFTQDKYCSNALKTFSLKTILFLISTGFCLFIKFNCTVFIHKKLIIIISISLWIGFLNSIHFFSWNAFSTLMLILVSFEMMIYLRIGSFILS